MLQNQYEIRVLVKGRPIAEYYHNGQTFIEGRDGSNFEIQFRNLTNQRVEALVAVDGRSVVDGDEASPESRGFVVAAHETIVIPGWKLDAEQAAAFLFAGKQQSYSAAMSGGKSHNTGVLGVMVFKEKVARTAFTGGGIMRSRFASPGVSPQITDYSYYGDPIRPTYGAAGHLGGVGMSRSASSSRTKGIPTTLENTFAGAKLSADTAYTSSTMDWMDMEQTRSMASVQPQNAVEQTLGTGFGQAQDFKTQEIEFNRGDLASQMVLYYDDARGLRARGIELSRKKAVRVQTTQPDAFPGFKKQTGCKPPPGWQG
jgi:hypothetical protein